jgi:hypothetical protein
VCEALRKHGVTAPIDVHLMVKPVDRIVPDFAKAGASLISFHPEASDHVDRTIQLLHASGCKAGLVFNPATPLTWLEHTLDQLDLVLIMSVNPGFGGQSFIPGALAKLRRAREIRRQDRRGNHAILSGHATLFDRCSPVGVRSIHSRRDGAPHLRSARYQPRSDFIRSYAILISRARSSARARSDSGTSPSLSG